ncbi:hypothetical protein SB822_61210, partial [Paraburkholderia sp. SIMBA_054]
EIYSAFEPRKNSLILDYRDFGYRRVRVLRPLRKKIVISTEGMAELAETGAWERRAVEVQTAWMGLLAGQLGAENDWQ